MKHTLNYGDAQRLRASLKSINTYPGLLSGKKVLIPAAKALTAIEAQLTYIHDAEKKLVEDCGVRNEDGSLAQVPLLNPDGSPVLEGDQMMFSVAIQPEKTEHYNTEKAALHSGIEVEFAQISEDDLPDEINPSHIAHFPLFSQYLIA